MWSLELELGVGGDGVAVSTYTLATFAKRKRRLSTAIHSDDEEMHMQDTEDGAKRVFQDGR